VPSPFPGMDPYLESPELWQDFHESFLPVARSLIQPQLPDRYRIRIDERLVIESPESAGVFYPDLAVLRRPEPRTAEAVAAYEAVPFDPPAVIDVLAEPWGESYLEIIDRQGGRVVTVVELLSPSNKQPGEAREQYLEKQRIIQEARTNLVEIDLLKEGLHTVGVPRGCLRHLEPFYSIISIWRGAKPRRYEVYPIRLRQRLPRIGIPLLPEDRDVVLDVQAVFTQCYDNAAYWKDIDYTQPPPVMLTPEDEAWRQEVIASAQLNRAAAEGEKQLP